MYIIGKRETSNLGTVTNHTEVRGNTGQLHNPEGRKSKSLQLI